MNDDRNLGEKRPPEASTPTARRPVAPPTVPKLALNQRKHQTWTIVVGVVGILISAYAAVMGLGGVMMVLNIGQMNGTWATGVSGARVSNVSMHSYMHAAGWDQVCSGLLAGLLLAGSIGLLMRKRWGARCIIAWAALKIIASPIFAVFIARGFSEMMQATAAQQKGGPPMPAGMFNAIAVGMAVFWGVVACIAPLAVLIFLLRHSIRDQVRAWK